MVWPDYRVKIRYRYEATVDFQFPMSAKKTTTVSASSQTHETAVFIQHNTFAQIIWVWVGSHTIVHTKLRSRQLSFILKRLLRFFILLAFWPFFLYFPFVLNFNYFFYFIQFFTKFQFLGISFKFLAISEVFFRRIGCNRLHNIAFCLIFIMQTKMRDW